MVLIGKEHIMPEIISRLPNINSKLSNFILQREILFLIKFPLDLHEKVSEISKGCEEVLQSHGWSSPGLEILRLRSELTVLSKSALFAKIQSISDRFCLSDIFSISNEIILTENQILSAHTATEFNTRKYQDFLTSQLSKIPQKTFLILVKATAILMDEEAKNQEKEADHCLQLLLSIPIGYEIRTPLEIDLGEMAFQYYKHKHYDLLPFELGYHMNWLQKLEKNFWEKFPEFKKKYKYPKAGYFVLQMLRVAFLFMSGNPEDAMKIGQKFINKSETMLISFIYTRQHVLFIMGVMTMESMETHHAVKYMSESKKCSSSIFNLIDLINQFQIN